MDIEAMMRAMSGGDRHPCTFPGCELIVEYDDEPWCFTHSPDSGSAVPGYSYRAGHPAAASPPGVPYGTIGLTAGISAPVERNDDDAGT